jgi:NADPH:quinone reductase-like Zn-dependent oxidoreductase
MIWQLATDEIVVEILAAGPGAGISGIVVARGAASGAAIGDEVFGRIRGGQPETFMVFRRGSLARKPAALSHDEAALLAAVGPAALSAVRLSGARAGDRVMITDASDEAGAIVVQIAKARGSRVTAVCPDRDVPLVWELGADEVVSRDRAGESGRFAAVIDTQRSVTPEIADQLLEPAGRLIVLQEDDVGEVALDELVALVERDRVFPVLHRGTDARGTSDACDSTKTGGRR